MQRGGLWAVAIGGGVCAAWLAWAWSPELESIDERAPEPLPRASPVAPPPAPSQPPTAAKPANAAQPTAAEVPRRQAPAVSAEGEGSAPAPERATTPHPMALEQARPPEQAGPLRELKQQYAGQSRSAASSTLEAQLRARLATPNIPPALIDALSCRRTICKLELRWTPTRRLGYVVVFQSLKQLYDQRVAVEPAPGPADDASLPVSLYVAVVP